MSILIVCQGCHTRFQVSDKFAGRTGSCPKCKAPIKVPGKGEEVKIHGAEHGPKDAKGQLVLKPIAREKTKLSPATLGWIAGGTAVVFLAALVLRAGPFRVPDKPGALNAFGTLLAAVGLIGVSPALCFAGYWFLRDREFLPYRGRELWVRVGICSAIYAALWAVFSPMSAWLAGLSDDVWIWLFIAPPFLVVGTLAAFGSLDLDLTSGFFHYSFYLVVTMLLRLAIGVALIGDLSAVGPVDDVPEW